MFDIQKRALDLRLEFHLAKMPAESKHRSIIYHSNIGQRKYRPHNFGSVQKKIKIQKISRNNLPWAIPTINLPFRTSVISTCTKGAMWWRRMCSLGLWANGILKEVPLGWSQRRKSSFWKGNALKLRRRCFLKKYFFDILFFFGFLPTPCVMGLHIYIIYEYLWCSMIKMINWQILITCYRMTLWSELVVYCALWSAAHLSVTVALGCVGPRSWVPETACPFLTLRWVAAGQQTLGVEQTKPLSRVEKVHMQQMNAEDILMHCKRDQNLEAVAVWIRLNCFGDKSTEF